MGCCAAKGRPPGVSTAPVKAPKGGQKILGGCGGDDDVQSNHSGGVERFAQSVNAHTISIKQQSSRGDAIYADTAVLTEVISLEKTGVTSGGTSDDTLQILYASPHPVPSTSAQQTVHDTYYPHPDLASCMTDLATWRSDGLPCESTETPSWKKGKLLGKGRHGAVYEGVDTAGVLIAVKVVESPQSETLYREYKDDLEKLKHLQHENIVQFFGCTHEECYINTFMEHCPGGSIGDLVACDGPLSVPHIRNYTKQTLKGLAYLHSRGVAHGDIKGANILIGMKGVVKIADIASNRALESQLSGGHNVIGTPAYVAPEIVQSPEAGVTLKGDIWALGCTVIEMLGHHPWDTPGMSPYALLFLIGNSEGPPQGLPRDIPLLLEDMVLRCFERRPEDRPGASELLTDPFFIPSLSTHNYIQHANITTITEDLSLLTSLSSSTAPESTLHSSCELDHYAYSRH